jgi:uncharacterized membrane protein SirB2
MTSSSPNLTNRFGRRPGRGLRPWLLLPKLLAVALYFGGLAAVATLWFSADFSSLAPFDPRRLLLLDHIGFLIRHLVVPALLAAMVFGFALHIQHAREFIRMRWLQVKLVTLALYIPSAHLFLSSRMALLRTAFSQHRADDSATRQFTIGLIAALMVSGAVIALARLKPRLAQNWARVYSTWGTNDPEPTNTDQ